MIRMSLDVEFQRTKKIELFSQGMDESKNLRCETLYIANYEYVNISRFAVLDIELWLEEDGELHTNHSLSSFQFIHAKA